MHGDSGRCFTIRGPMVGVAVHNQIGALAIYDFRESRGA
jgi:hypothetical protein